MTTQKLQLEWQGINFRLSFTQDYSGIGNLMHLEVHCDEPLPITETGYKSLFIQDDAIKDIKLAAALIRNEMDREAKRLNWQRDMQLSLF